MAALREGNMSHIDRRQFVAGLIAQIPDALIVTGLGSAAYDVFAAGDRDENFYLWGAMGGAAATGLGLALARPERKVVVVTGDGEMLMGIGTLATIAARAPDNLSVVVLNNGHFGETGMQPSHTSCGTRLESVAQGFGIAHTLTLESIDGLTALVAQIQARSGAVFADVLIAVDEPPRRLPPRDCSFVKNRFRRALGLSPF
ncbi:aldehyde dehydrogenase [Pluralibacter gergoviae]|nr:aldehyde dehydrogenase [Pluralibacter gergoviae]